MLESTEVQILLLAALSVGVFHNLTPGHWLPFVLVGRARKWTLKRTVGIAAFAAAGHVFTSIAVGVIGLYLGATVSERYASLTETLGAAALMLFGLGYALYAWWKGGHVHGHRVALPADARGDPAANAHDHQPGHALLHEHVHSVEEIAEGSGPGWTLVAIIAFSPCVPLLPLAFEAGRMGGEVVVAVMACFALVSIASMAGIVTLVFAGVAQLRLEFFEKRGDIISGLIIFAIGVFVILFGD